ncbi:MAG TPA: hypothetical protein VI299_15195, partial [Polyangiales bacterium]
LVANKWPANDTDPDQTSFSNNIGVYHQVFTITPKQTGLTKKLDLSSPALLTQANLRAKAITVSDSGAMRTTVPQGQSTEIHATLNNPAEPMEAINVYFYDGNPEQGGKLFDMERVPHLDTTGQHKLRVRYAPEECGAHDIYLKASNQGLRGDAQRIETVQVDCSAAHKSTGVPHSDGCSIASNARPSGSSWLFPLGMVASALAWRRRRHVAR